MEMKLYPIAAVLLFMGVHAQKQNTVEENQKHLQKLYAKYDKDLKRYIKMQKQQEYLLIYIMKRTIKEPWTL